MSEPITRVQRKDGTVRYRLRVDTGIRPDGKRGQRCMTFRTAKEARQALAKIRHEVAEGKYVAPTKITVADYLDQWVEGRRDLRINTRQMYRNVLLHVTDAYGGKALQSLSKKDLDDLVKVMTTTGRRQGHKGTPLSPTTVTQMLVVLGRALEDAVRAGLISRNVAGLVEKPRRTAPTTQRWSEQEMSAFLDLAAEDRLYACWRLSALGLRRGEVLGLRWADLDLDGGTLSIAQSRVALNDGTTIVDAPKTARSRRVLPLDPSLVAALKALRARQAAERLAAGEAYTGTSDLVAVDELGRPARPEHYSDLFARLAKRAGLPTIRLHDLRHSALSIMAERGVPVSLIAAWAGHSDGGSLALKVYVHPSTEGLAQAGRSLEMALSAQFV